MMSWRKRAGVEVEGARGGVADPVPTEEAADPVPGSSATTEEASAGNGHRPGLPRTTDLWSDGAKGEPRDEKGRRQDRSAVGVVVDGTTAHRAQVRHGHVVSYEAFREATPREALKKALAGTKGATVVFLQGLLFSEEAQLPRAPARLLPSALLDLGKEKWPAAELAAVAALPRPTGEETAEKAKGRPVEAALVGWDSHVSDDFWDLLRQAGARLVPLPSVVPSDGVWLFAGLDRSWLVVAHGKQVSACRELKAGSSDVQQLASQVSVEVSRLSKSGETQGSPGGTSLRRGLVSATGLVLDQATMASFSRLGVLATPPPLPGVSRWEIPWAEQGPAALAVLASLADVPPLAIYRSRAEIARIVDAPRRRARLAIIGATSAVALGVLVAALLSWSSASSSLSSAKSALALASQEAASVSHWADLRSEVLSLSGEVAKLRSPDASFGPALSIITGTAPPGAQVSTLSAILQGGDIAMTVAATVPNGTFEDIAIWQQRMEAIGATVQVVGESKGQGGASVSMQVTSPLVPSSGLPKGATRRPREPRAVAHRGHRRAVVGATKRVK